MSAPAVPHHGLDLVDPDEAFTALGLSRRRAPGAGGHRRPGRAGHPRRRHRALPAQHRPRPAAGRDRQRMPRCVPSSRHAWPVTASTPGDRSCGRATRPPTDASTSQPTAGHPRPRAGGRSADRPCHHVPPAIPRPSPGWVSGGVRRSIGVPSRPAWRRSSRPACWRRPWPPRALPGGPPGIQRHGLPRGLRRARGPRDLVVGQGAAAQRTWAYARRQGTWFRSEPDIAWLEAGEGAAARARLALWAVPPVRRPRRLCWRAMTRSDLIDLAPPVERAFLIAVDTGADEGWTAEDSLAELASLADTAGAEVVGAEWQHRRHVDPNWYLGKGKAEELRAAQRGDRLHAARRRRRAEAQPAAVAGGAAVGQGPRPQRPHPGHLRAARADPRGSPPGGAGPAGVPAAAPDAPVDAPLAHRRRHRHPRSRRDPAGDRPPRHPRPHQQAQGARRAGPPAARDRRPLARPAPRAHRRHRGLHERRQVIAAQRADRSRGRARRGPPLRHARPHQPPGEAR